MKWLFSLTGSYSSGFVATWQEKRQFFLLPSITSDLLESSQCSEAISSIFGIALIYPFNPRQSRG